MQILDSFPFSLEIALAENAFFLLRREEQKKILLDCLGEIKGNEVIIILSNWTRERKILVRSLLCTYSNIYASEHFQRGKRPFLYSAT